MAAEQLARVLHLQVALERRLEQVACSSGERNRRAEGDRLGDREKVLLVEGEERDRDRSQRAGDEPLPRLARRDRRRQLVPPEQPRPPKYAAVSAAKTASRTVKTPAEAVLGRCRGAGAGARGRARSRPTPSTVDADRRRSADCRVAGEPVKQERERERREQKPPSIHSRPPSCGAEQRRERARRSPPSTSGRSGRVIT